MTKSKQDRLNHSPKLPLFGKARFSKVGARWKTLQADIKGTFSIFFGLSFMVLMCAVGAAFDLAQYNRAKALAQYTADNMALSASVAVDRKNPDKYTNDTDYQYGDIGGVGVDFTNSITGSVNYSAEDADGLLLARATVTGTYTPAFMSIFGVNTLNFSAVADVAYAQQEVKPATVFLILDNSGSMEWDDTAGNAKTQGLKDTVREFMVDLETKTGGEDPRVLRTSMLNFSTENIIAETGQQNCFWQPQPDVWVWDFWPIWGHDEPQPDIEICNPVTIQTGSDAIYDESFVAPLWGRVPDNMIDLIVANGGTDPSDALLQVNTWINSETGPSGAHDMVNNELDPLQFIILMTDGKIESNDNAFALQESETQCTDIKTKTNTFIYTIGYDLRAGQPTVGGVPYEIPPGFLNSGPVNILQTDVDAAQTFLAGCATDANHYILANDTADLNDAFKKIGNKIVEEVIRVKS